MTIRVITIQAFAFRLWPFAKYNTMRDKIIVYWTDQSINPQHQLGFKPALGGRSLY